MDWAKERARWPFSESSQFVLHKPHRWHVQDIGEGPILLLLHGAGGSTHSWRNLVPYLTQKYRVIAIDLPGQGFTQCGAQHRCGLDAMAEDILSLCASKNWQPVTIIGHSAGAAIALRMSEIAQTDTVSVIGINAALDTFQGVAGLLFPMLAKTMAALPFSADVFCAATTRANGVAKIISGTGSKLQDDDLFFYHRLVANRGHVNATLQMMAQWNLDPFIRRLPKIKTRTLLISTNNDKAVPPKTSQSAAEKLQNGYNIALPELGHLAQEENASKIAKLILAELDQGSASH